VRDVLQSTGSNNLEVLKGSMNSDGKPATKVQLVEKAMALAAATTLMTYGRRRRGWFEEASTVLNTAIKTRNQVSSAYFNHPTNEFQLKLKKARKAVKRKVKQALTDWTEHLVAEVSGKESSNDRRPLTPKDFWAAMREISHGPRTAKDLKPLQ
jgi:hypothetical protein